MNEDTRRKQSEHFFSSEKDKKKFEEVSDRYNKMLPMIEKLKLSADDNIKKTLVEISALKDKIPANAPVTTRAAIKAQKENLDKFIGKMIYLEKSCIEVLKQKSSALDNHLDVLKIQKTVNVHDVSESFKKLSKKDVIIGNVLNSYRIFHDAAKEKTPNIFRVVEALSEYENSMVKIHNHVIKLRDDFATLSDRIDDMMQVSKNIPEKDIKILDELEDKIKTILDSDDLNLPEFGNLLEQYETEVNRVKADNDKKMDQEKYLNKEYLEELNNRFIEVTSGLQDSHVIESLNDDLLKPATALMYKARGQLQKYPEDDRTLETMKEYEQEIEKLNGLVKKNKSIPKNEDDEVKSTNEVSTKPVMPEKPKTTVQHHGQDYAVAAVSAETQSPKREQRTFDEQLKEVKEKLKRAKTEEAKASIDNLKIEKSSSAILRAKNLTPASNVPDKDVSPSTTRPRMGSKGDKES